MVTVTAQTVDDIAVTTRIMTSFPTSSLTPTPKSTAKKEAAPTSTMVPQPSRTISPATLTAKSTITAFGTVCESPAEDYGAEISPDGKWIAMACRGKDGGVDSYLRVVNMLGENKWDIHYADYAHGEEYDRNNLIYPFHWSQNGMYLYAASPSKAGGCCWLGDYMLLVRLNLKNGHQTEVVKFDHSIPAADFSFSPSERYFLYIPQDGQDQLFILDLLTWSTRVIKLGFENTGAGYTLMSNNDEQIILMLREYPQENQGDLTLGSLIVIDLRNNSQRKLLSGMEYEKTPKPIGWKDNDHVLLKGEDKFWFLNVNTAELTETEKP